MLKSFIYYASYLVFPFIFLIIYYRKKINKILFIILFILSILFIYGRFIEVNIINTVQHDIVNVFNQSEVIKIAVVSDFHIGIYTKKEILKKVVSKINEENPDLVILAGDFLYNLEKNKISTAFKDFQEINSPTYAVSGNHDSGFPGGDYRKEIEKSLEEIGVNFIDNEIIKFNKNNLEFSIIGLSDIWTSDTDFSLLDDFKKEDYVIVASHNPDIAYDLDSEKVDLLISGHTHGGQIRIPFLYKYVIPTKYNFDKNYSIANNIQTFVSPGIGTVGLPLRLFMPPQLDIINIK